MFEIAIIAYPRSGSTWLTRLVGDVLNCPIRDFPGEKSLAAEERPENGYVAHQTHIVDMIPEDAYAIHILRDPRDIAVSMYHYWELSDLDLAIDCLLIGDLPPVYLPKWNYFIKRAEQRANLTFRYADLYTTPKQVLWKIYKLLNLMPNMTRIKEAVERQSFAHALENSNPTNYYPEIHRHALRRGVVGDWHNYFSIAQRARLESELGETMRAYGFLKESVR